MNRSGIGYDVHRFAEGRKLILGGVEIPHARGLEGHSDADVSAHAIADALLGAIGERDIGHHFPNTDESIRGISSLEILQRVGDNLGGEKMPDRECRCDADCGSAEDRGRISRPCGGRFPRVLGIDVSRVGIKATTNEGMGALGRGEGMAAIAVASVEQSE